MSDTREQHTHVSNTGERHTQASDTQASDTHCLSNTRIMYLFLSSDDSLKIHENNKAIDFIVTLPSPLYLDREARWECGLCDLSITTKDSASVKRADRLHVYCNLIETSYEQGSTQPILKTAQLKAVKNNVAFYNPPYYMRVAQERIDSIHIYLRLDKGQIPSFDDGITSCTLHLRAV